MIPDHLVRWQHSGTMPEDWMGTEICFQIQPGDEQCMVNFSHSNWQQTSDFMAHCSMKWAVFMLSLKDAIEKGQGNPYPDDIHIDHSDN